MHIKLKLKIPTWMSISALSGGSMIESLIGVLGHMLLALCALPQAIQAVRTKSSAGINSTFIAMWLIGEILAMVYVLMKDTDLIQLSNYLLNLACLLPIIYYKLRERV